MTTWSDKGDLHVDTDEYDPTSPIFERDESTGMSIETDLAGNPLATEEPSADLFLPDGSPNWERGFGDGSKCVRVWAHDDGEIHKVRVSPNWRERVGARGKPAEFQAAALARSFTASFAFINILQQRPPAGSAPKVTADGPGDRPITWVDLNRINKELASLRERLRAIPADRGRGHWRGEPVAGRGAGGKVVVRLNETGGYSSIEFAPDWLADSHVGMICNAVPEATRSARARFVPPEYVPGERDELTNKAATLRQELSAMMQRGFE